MKTGNYLTSENFKDYRCSNFWARLNRYYSAVNRPFHLPSCIHSFTSLHLLPLQNPKSESDPYSSPWQQREKGKEIGRRETSWKLEALCKDGFRLLQMCLSLYYLLFHWIITQIIKKIVLWILSRWKEHIIVYIYN